MNPKRRDVLIALGLALLLLPAGGCPRLGGNNSRAIPYTIGRLNGKATLSIGAVTLIFDDVPMAGPDAPALAAGTLMVAGSGSASGTSGVNEATLKHSYSNGTQKLSVGNHAFSITANGTLLEVGSAKYPLNAQTTVLRIDKDGVVTKVP